MRNAAVLLAAVRTLHMLGAGPSVKVQVGATGLRVKANVGGLMIDDTFKSVHHMRHVIEGRGCYAR